MNRALTRAMAAIGLTMLAATAVPRAGAERWTAVRSRLPATLDGALDDRDPAALADTSLPRLATLSATDPESLISATYYSVDSGPYHAYAAPFPISSDGLVSLRTAKIKV